ncbi:transglycosylase SLT domain-containing protein [Rhizobium sp. 18055]|uniref:transglycosylase SLT domain-containing protein n=1 Tax=Rhizobium sp. 18055 TaxID=2681403 RepID=UPI00135B837D|nr:transglycosylase SLT domain-containing protein [Rhizobium sp. 18055]
MLRSLKFVTLSVLTMVLCQPAWADVPVIDDDVKGKRADDEDHSAADKETQIDQLEEQAVTSCNISKKEKNRRLFRSPAQAVEEDAENVELIKHYAEKYNVPTGLALAVAHAESGISTCSGSPTGVKGVMQLTKRTGSSMGFDRDINEENIEGGVKYLGLGVAKCGSTDYACLASWYNGSTATEQANWAGKVARNHNWFNAYAGGSNIADIPSPTFKTSVDYGSNATRNSTNAAVDAVNTSVTGIDTSTARIQEANNRLSALTSTVGASEIYQDAWDDNTQARAVNAELLNNLISVTNLANTLIQARMQMKLSSMSVASKSLKSDSSKNPYSCDPIILERTNVPRVQWPECALLAATNADGTESEVAASRNDSSVENSLEAIQQAAEAAE